MTIAELARPEIRALEPYAAAVQVDDTIRLNANEMPWANHGDRFRRPLNRYPEIRPAGLRSTLAQRYGCGPKNLLVSRGSSEGIEAARCWSVNTSILWISRSAAPLITKRPLTYCILRENGERTRTRTLDPLIKHELSDRWSPRN